MTRTIITRLAGSVAALVVATGLLKSQKAPEPPELPEAPAEIPDAPIPPDPLTLIDNFSLFSATPWLGVRLKEITSDKARELKLPGEYGVLVDEVEGDSPAGKAGLAKNDVLLEFAGERVRSTVQLQRLVRETPPDRTVPIEISRAGERRTLNVKLEPGHPFAFSAISPRGGEQRIFKYGPREYNFRLSTRGASLGITGDELTKQLAEYFGVKEGKGVLVREVLVGSAAEKAGLKAGDVIVKADSHEVASVSDLRRALPRDTDEKRKVALTIVRDRREQTLSVELEPVDRSPLRRAETVDFLGVDSQEFARWAAEWKRQLAEQMEKYKAELAKHREQWKRAGQRQWEEYRHQIADQYRRVRERYGREVNHYQRQLKERLERERRTMLDQSRGRESVV